MGGFRDLLALLLGWRSADSGADPPYRTIVGNLWHTGAAAGQHQGTGQRAGQIHSSSKTAGQING